MYAPPSCTSNVRNAQTTDAYRYGTMPIENEVPVGSRKANATMEKKNDGASRTGPATSA